MRKALCAGVLATGLLLAGCESLPTGTLGTLGGLLGSKELTTETIVAGLKDALRVGTERAVGLLAKPGGYSANPVLKLVVPEQLEKVTSTLRKIGMGSQVDQFEAKMNEAAEQAVAQAVSVFATAVSEMTFEDAKAILHGDDTAATEYFKRKTLAHLHELYAPIVRRKMDEVGAAKVYTSLLEKYNAIPFVAKPDFSLERYVTDKALAGVFMKLGEMEKDIRANPAARTTDLLKSVFGSLNHK
jgi:hypothetical protein